MNIESNIVIKMVFGFRDVCLTNVKSVLHFSFLLSKHNIPSIMRLLLEITNSWVNTHDKLVPFNSIFFQKVKTSQEALGSRLYTWHLVSSDIKWKLAFTVSCFYARCEFMFFQFLNKYICSNNLSLESPTPVWFVLYWYII